MLVFRLLSKDCISDFISEELSKELQKTVSFMGDLYWSSLVNSFMDFYWFNLMKRNCFRHVVTVL